MWVLPPIEPPWSCLNKVKRGKGTLQNLSTPIEESGTLFNALCTVTAAANSQQHVRHHCHNKSTDKWIKQPSKLQPVLPLSIQITDEDYQHLGFQPIANTNSQRITIQAMADSGCHSCLVGFRCTLPIIEVWKFLGQLYSASLERISVLNWAFLWSDTLENSFFQTCRWLDTCGKNGIIQNPSKFVFASGTVEFSGFEITPDNVRPSPAILRAISDFPTPKNLTDIRSWFGLVNQVTYAFSMTDKMLLFRELLKPKNTFHWDTNRQNLLHYIITIKNKDSGRDWTQSQNLWQEETYMHCHRLVENRHRFLAFPEALQLPREHSILLSWRMADCLSR